MAANATRDQQLKAKSKLGQGNALFRDAEQLHNPIQYVAGMRAAIAAYREAQALDPDLFDAEFNRKIAERRLQDPPKQPFASPGMAPPPVASPQKPSDAERILKEASARVPPAGARVKDDTVERDW